MLRASAYDPTSPNEQPVFLPNAPIQALSPGIVLQPPLSRRGTGPGIILILPSPGETYSSRLPGAAIPLDPEPIQKWAEEGFAVVGVIPNNNWKCADALKKSIDGLLSREVDTQNKFGVIVYDPRFLEIVSTTLTVDSRLVCLIGYGSAPALQVAVPTLVHLTSDSKTDPKPGLLTTYAYPASSPHFVLPDSLDYVPGSAALAHTRSLVFLRKWLGGPFFDLEAIWDEHTRYEFEERSVAKTMGTMVAEPYVNHVPTMTGGIGRENLTAFYRDHFIFVNPPDATLELISRTVGPDRVVDEFIYRCTHDRVIDVFMPGVPPTGKKLEIPMIAVVNIRGDRLYNEHIWWDQATALRQAGILPTHLPYSTPDGLKKLRLPVAGVECARMLLDEASGKSNEMFGEGWGVLD